MRAQADVMTNHIGDESGAFGSLRNVEIRELLRAVAALRLDGMLTEDEYEAKRERLGGPSLTDFR